MQVARAYASNHQGSRRNKVSLAIAAAALSVCASQHATAITGSWSGNGADNTWSTAANWDAIPGSNDGLAGTNTDTALFSGVPTVTSVGVDLNRNIGSILFDNSGSSFTIGSAAGNALYLTGGGQIRVGSGITGGVDPVTQNIVVAAPLVLNGNSYTITSDTAAQTFISVRTSGPISAGTAAATALTLNGTHAGAGNNQSPAQIHSLVSDGAGTMGIVKSGSGIWELRPGNVTDASAAGTAFPTNSFTGQTIINQGMLRISGPGGTSPNSDVILNGNGATIRFSVNDASVNNPGLHATMKSLTIVGNATGSGTLNASNSGSKTIVAPPTGPAVTIDYSAFTGTFAPGGAILWLRGPVDGDGGYRYLAGPNTAVTVWAQAIDLGTLNRPFDVSHAATFNPTRDLDVSGSISGTGGIIKKGDGILFVRNSNNTFTGQIEVQAGTFTVGASNTLRGANNVLIDGGTLSLFGTNNQSFPLGAITLTSGAFTSSNDGRMYAASYAFNVAAAGTGTVSANLFDGASPSSVTKSGGGLVIMSGVSNSYTGSTNVNAGTLRFTTAGVLPAASAVNVSGTGVLDLAAGRATATKVLSITAADSGAVDVNDNDLVISNATPQSTVENYVRTARNNGLWNGSGITSSTARVQPSSNTGLGVLSGAELDAFGGGTGTFNGTPYVPTDTLVKYTWNGDTNLNGVVNFDDYVRVDVGFNTNLTGWGNGDFNYSGGVNFDDYVMIDVAFNTQSGTLGRAIQYVTGEDGSDGGMNNPALQEVAEHFGQFGAPYANAFLAAVPEPGSIAAILGVPALAGIARRRRRR